MSPISNAFIDPAHADATERFYPLHAFVCRDCWLVQLAAFETPARLFGDYRYFSSYSHSWLLHAETYVATISERLRLGAGSRVVEVASNDGYLLQYFVRRGIPALGIEPAENVASVARARGVRTIARFFGVAAAEALRAEGEAADLIVANNVLAHVPDLNDFVRGFKLLLAPEGVLTLEFPHLLRLLDLVQFDTIYHEHFSYFSFLVACRVLAAHGLAVFDVEELSTHGGSLRLYVQHADSGPYVPRCGVAELRARETAAGLDSSAPYRAFARRVVERKCAIQAFFISAHRAGARVAGYGAPAKGNTLLNACGIHADMMTFTVDASPHKQGLLLPGTRIPIRAPAAIRTEKPDYLFILPWNLREEIMREMADIRDWGGRFVVPIPDLTVL
jgi:2-polyprenyl-3-methyl-5-hydroxy-6-metoxy-1,4-benzoquinol methylase